MGRRSGEGGAHGCVYGGGIRLGRRLTGSVALIIQKDMSAPVLLYAAIRANCSAVPAATSAAAAPVLLHHQYAACTTSGLPGQTNEMQGLKIQTGSRVAQQ